MSVWPQAVWIVKKLQKNFDFSKQINNYTFGLNTLNATVNTLNNRVATDEAKINNFDNQINQVKSQLLTRAVTIVATKKSSGNEPDTTKEYNDGAIWLVV